MLRPVRATDSQLADGVISPAIGGSGRGEPARIVVFASHHSEGEPTGHGLRVHPAGTIGWGASAELAKAVPPPAIRSAVGRHAAGKILTSTQRGERVPGHGFGGSHHPAWNAELAG